MHIEDLNDAIKAAVDAIGGPKVVGATLWPDLDPSAAGNRLRDCLNPTRRERLTPEQLALIRRKARDAGSHVLASFEMKAAGYSRPTPIAPDDEKAELQRQAIEAARTMKDLVERMELLAWGAQ
jgi:hypothetical protein